MSDLLSTTCPPESPPPFDLVGDERPLHSVTVRGYRYLPGAPSPVHETYRGHLTTRRLVLLPIPEDAALGLEPMALPWNDLIEIRAAAGSRLPETLPGAEDHMLLIEARSRDAREFAEMFLFTVEPPAGAAPPDRPRYAAAFVERVEELLLDAFEA